MKQSTRKFIGVIATFSFLVFYALLMMVAGALIFGSSDSGWAHLAFYVLAGMGWLPVAMVIIKWMARPDEPR